MTENDKFKDFFISINNLINSKYIFATTYISELLHSIADNDEIYNLIAKCMINFDFIEEWQYAISDGRLVLPDENSRRIAFIFCMLNNIDDKNIDLNKVLEHYYSYDVEKKSFELFKEEIVCEFRNLIFSELNIEYSIDNNHFEEDFENTDDFDNENSIEPEQDIEKSDDENVSETIMSEDSLQEDLDKMLTLVLEMKNQVRKMKKLKGTPISKPDLIALASTLEFAIKTNASEYFYGLVLSIKYLVKPMKNLRLIIEEIEEISNKVIRS